MRLFVIVMVYFWCITISFGQKNDTTRVQVQGIKFSTPIFFSKDLKTYYRYSGQVEGFQEFQVLKKLKIGYGVYFGYNKEYNIYGNSIGYGVKDTIQTYFFKTTNSAATFGIPLIFNAKLFNNEKFDFSFIMSFFPEYHFYRKSDYDYFYTKLFSKQNDYETRLISESPIYFSPKTKNNLYKNLRFYSKVGMQFTFKNLWFLELYHFIKKKPNIGLSFGYLFGKKMDENI